MDCKCNPEGACEECAHRARIQALHSRHEARRKVVALRLQLRTEWRPEMAKSIRAKILFLQAR